MDFVDRESYPGSRRRRRHRSSLEQTAPTQTAVRVGLSSGDCASIAAIKPQRRLAMSANSPTLRSTRRSGAVTAAMASSPDACGLRVTNTYADVKTINLPTCSPQYLLI